MTDLNAISLRMSDDEKNALIKCIRRSSCYLEFGAGGSTELAVALGCPYIASVENDPVWISKLSKKEPIAERLRAGTLTFHVVDTGPVGDWGMPTSDENIRQWPNYAVAPFAKNRTYDFILIDGRFRQSCALVSWAFLPKDGLIALHDYNFRQEYFDVEKFYNVEEKIDSLVIFSRKEKIICESYVLSLMKSALIVR